MPVVAKRVPGYFLAGTDWTRSIAGIYRQYYALNSAGVGTTPSLSSACLRFFQLTAVTRGHS